MREFMIQHLSAPENTYICRYIYIYICAPTYAVIACIHINMHALLSPLGVSGRLPPFSPVESVPLATRGPRPEARSPAVPRRKRETHFPTKPRSRNPVFGSVKVGFRSPDLRHLRFNPREPGSRACGPQCQSWGFPQIPERIASQVSGLYGCGTTFPIF